MPSTLLAGAAAVDITPDKSLFLYGYPHVERDSTGVHDPLLSSALYLSDGQHQVMFIANDTLFIARSTAARVRARIGQTTGIPSKNILISATHTHSAPLAVEYSRREVEAGAPDPDPQYLQQVEDGIVQAAVTAWRNSVPARIGVALADATGIGTNRHSPDGPADLQVPVLVVQHAMNDQYLAAMLVCCMHPTVLHEDSTLISGDFPAMARRYLQRTLLGENCPVLHHSGPAGNQSPRHVTRANTFAEAERLGQILGQAVASSIETIAYSRQVPIDCQSTAIDLPRREPPSVAEARKRVKSAHDRLEKLRASNAPRTEVRTAECDWFGAEESCTLAESGAEGKLEAVYRACLPAEVQIIRIGPWAFVGWPCEVFVEFGLEIKAHHPGAFVISLANGELRGYVVTEEALRNGWYEAGNALFRSPDSGRLLVEATHRLLDNAASWPKF